MFRLDVKSSKKERCIKMYKLIEFREIAKKKQKKRKKKVEFLKFVWIKEENSFFLKTFFYKIPHKDDMTLFN